ncbi:MAG: transporter ATP-binding protein [Burkholderiales bacterium]|jgi:putative ATP-binding cassette transporter|nr:transporter ATP-binding protein [Burkholderiales bacterium]
MDKKAKRQSTSNRSPLIWIKDAWFLARPYWTGPDKYKATALITVVIIFNLLMVATSVVFNKWNNAFYNTLQNFDKVKFYQLIIKFCFIAIFSITCAVLAYYFRKILEIRWRRWLTAYYLDKWFQSKAYYKTKFLSQVSDNPDQRISDDINSFIVLVMELSLGLINAIVTLCSFSVILWTLSGSLKFMLSYYHIVIPGYMLWVAILYALIGTYITFKIGRPLIKLDYQQQAYEADFRFGLMRIREHSENIAFYNGETQEKIILTNRFTNVVNNFVSIIYRQLKIDIFGIGYGRVANIFPILVAAPRYFAKVIQLGDLMQIANAFGHVQGALSYFINAYSSLSGWRATMDRLYGFLLTIENAEKLDGLNIQTNNSYLRLDKVGIKLPNGNPLAKNISFDLNSGDCLLIKGRSGSGKTTLLRTIASLWPFANGNIYQKNNLHSIFITQKPYLPIDTLKNAICYPQTQSLPNDAKINGLLVKCSLGNLNNRLNDLASWSDILSIGEQQKIAFCRILINKPDIIYLDEATSALDEETEELMYSLIKSELPQSVIVSVGHRSTIAKWHNHTLDFNKLIA